MTSVKDRIQNLFPGDGNKAIRNKIYRCEGILKGDPTDAEIMEAAGLQAGPVEPAIGKVGKLLTPEEAAAKVEREALDLAGQQPLVEIKGPEDFERSSRYFSMIQKTRTANEQERKAITAPILETKRRIDEKYKAADAVLASAQAPHEAGMIAYKAKEREAMRQQEAERQAILDAAKAEREAEVAAAMAKLEEARKVQAEAEEDPFLTALDEDMPSVSIIPTLVAEVKDAMRSVAMVTVTTALPEAQAPVVGSGTRVSYPKVITVINEDLVSRELCSPDSRKLTALARDLKDVDINSINPFDYPGLRITEEIRIGGR